MLSMWGPEVDGILSEEDGGLHIQTGKMEPVVYVNESMNKRLFIVHSFFILFSRFPI